MRCKLYNVIFNVIVIFKEHHRGNEEQVLVLTALIVLGLQRRLKISIVYNTVSLIN